MALHWNIGDVKDHETLCLEDHEDGDGSKKLTDATYSLVWATIPVGLGAITEKNWREFWVRLRFVEHLGNAYRFRFVDDGEGGKRRQDIYFTPEEVHAHIGLRTNASPMSKTAFLKNRWDWLEREMGHAIRQFEREVLKLDEEDEFVAEGEI